MNCEWNVVNIINEIKIIELVVRATITILETQRQQ